MERIDFLSYIMHTDPEIINEKKEDVSLNNKETFSSKKSSIGDTSTHSNMVAGNPNTQNSSRSPKQEYFNSVFLNMFTKRKTNKKETTHHSHSSSQKHKNLYPKASKSTPTTIPESLWKRQSKLLVVKDNTLFFN